MALDLQDFTTLVRNQVAAIQAQAQKLLNFTVGSILLAIVESIAGVVLWLQGLIVKLLATTRAATCKGNDLDTWMADYGLTRLPAVASTGAVTFSRFTPSLQAVVPIGAQVETEDGSQVFNVIIDINNPNYNPSLGGYVLQPGIANIDVPVQDAVAGAAGNVASGAINTIAQAIPGVDTVINANNFTNGENAESDAAFRARFVEYMGSLAEATPSAVAYAVESVQQDLSYAIVEDEDYNGTPDGGFFYVVIDDGSGNPPSTLIASVSNAVNAVRPVGTRFAIFPPVVITASVNMTITTAPDYVHADVVAAVQAAITAKINALPLGGTLAYTRLAQWAYDTSPGVTNVSNITLNGGTSDMTATAQQAIKPGSIVVQLPLGLSHSS